VGELLSGRNQNSDVEELLQAAVQEANRRVFEAQKLNPEYRGMGSTLTVLTIPDNRFYLAQVGDSRAYLYRNKTLSQLSRDHSLVWPLFEKGLMSKDDISRHPQKNLITRSIGTHPEVEADLDNGALIEGDVFLLCSDGLTDVLSDHDILQILSNGSMNPQEMSEKLVQAANFGGGPDNVTVVVVSVRP
jgi:protein phosphatase